MTRILDLGDAAWELRESLGDMWQWYVDADRAQRNSVRPETRRDGWFAARVPGSVVDDLVRAGEIAEPRHARRSRDAEWVAERTWVYRAGIRLDVLAAGESAWIDVEGIDPGGRVFWDGAEIGAVEGLHRRARMLVGRAGEDAVAPGIHSLMVVVPPATVSEPQVGVTGRVRLLAPRVGHGWDFSPRLRHQGIWRALTLVTGESALRDVRVRTALDLGTRRGSVDLAAAVDGGAGSVTAELARDGRMVARVAAPVVDGEALLRLDVPDAEPWWPAAYGPQTLYDLRLTAGAHERTVRVGFRDARLVGNTGAPSGALGYTAEVNGVRMPLPGWNWAPADAQLGSADRERVRHLLDLAADSGARLLRVWGGGVLESDDFYDLCDERGLLVWQEFSQSSSGIRSAPAEDDAFVAHVADEARHAAARLSRHPSLFVWGGGNELEDDTGPLDETRSPALAALRAALEEADPGRPWLPTSPSGPVFHHRLDRILADPDGQHDVHGPWEHQGLEAHHSLADAGTSLAHTEFGVEGMASLRQVEALIPPDRRWPADRSNPVYRHLGDWWNNADLVGEMFGGRLGDLEALQRASQWLQATGLQYAVEGDRRRWPRCSMVLPWQLAESFPNAWCTSAVEWSGEAKPAFHAVRRAFGTRRVTLRTPRLAWSGHAELTAEAWAWSERPVAAGSRVTLRLRDLAGDVLAEAVSAPLDAVTDPRAALSLAAAHPGGDDLVLWEAEWRGPDGGVLDTERAVAALGPDFGPLLDLGAARLRVRTDADGDVWRVHLAHEGGPALVGGGVEDARPWGAPGRLLVRQDPRPLLAGEERVLEVRWYDVAPRERALTFDAWNAPARALRPDVAE